MCAVSTDQVNGAVSARTSTSKSSTSPRRRWTESPTRSWRWAPSWTPKAKPRSSPPECAAGSTACRRRSQGWRPRRACSSPSGSSRPTRPGIGCRTWWSQPAAPTSPGCPASRRTGCAGWTSPARAGCRRPRALRLRPRPHARRGRPARASAHLLGTPARQSAVFAVDANATFSRPGPRVVDGVEVLAHLLTRASTRIRASPGAGSASVDPDQDLVAAHGGLEAACGVVAVEARSRSKVEAPAVVRALSWSPRTSPSTSGLPSCGQALSNAWISPATRSSRIWRPSPSTTARSPARTSAGTLSHRSAVSSTRPTLSGPVPLYLREADVEQLLTPEDAVEAVEGCFAAWRAGRSRTGRGSGSA